MAFTPPEVLYELDFVGTELDGLTVTAASADIGTIVDIASLMGDVDDAAISNADPEDPRTGEALKPAMSKLSQIIEMYGALLRDWDMEIPKGTPLPPTVEGLRKVQPRHLMLIIKAWQQAVTQVPDDLGKGSTSGASPLVASLEMAPPSASLPS